MVIIKNLSWLTLGFLLGWYAHYQLNKNSIIPTQNPLQSAYTITESQTSIEPAITIKIANNQPQIFFKDFVPKKTPKQQLLQDFNLAKQQQNWTLALKLFNQLSKENAYSSETLITKARLLAKQQKYELALSVFEGLFIQPQLAETQSKLQIEILALSQLYLAQYSGELNQYKRLDFLMRVVNLLPEILETHYLLALAFLEVGDIYQAKIELGFLEANGQLTQQTALLKKQIIQAQRFKLGAVKVKLTYKNNGWVLKAILGQTNEVNLLLDTGANATLISQAVLGKIDKNHYLQYRSPVSIQTASGSDTVYRIKIQQMSIGPIIDKDFSILVTTPNKLPQGIDGLLGTDWLNRFEFDIDQKNNILILQKK